MSVLLWVAAAWLAATAGLTLAFFGARRSRLLYVWLFGERTTAEMHRIVPAAPDTAKPTARLAA